jgi:hypothetical protein
VVLEARVLHGLEKDPQVGLVPVPGVVLFGSVEVEIARENYALVRFTCFGYLRRKDVEFSFLAFCRAPLSVDCTNKCNTVQNVGSA